MYRNSTLRMNRLYANDSYSDLAYKLLFFILWPFGVFVHSVFHIRQKSSFVIFVLYGILFCWRLNPNNTTQSDDFNNICEVFFASKWTFADLWNQFEALITFSPDIKERDVYENFLCWLTKLFTESNYHLHFAFASILYLYFSLKSLKFITDDKKFEQSFNKKFEQSLLCLVVILLFVIPRDIITVQNPRYTTAHWFIIFSILSFIIKGDLKYLFLLPFAYILHSGTGLLVCIFYLGYIFRKYVNIAFVIFCISIPFALTPSDENIGMDLWFTQYLPPIFSDYIHRVFSESMYEKLVAQSDRTGYIWVTLLFNMLMKLSHIIVIILLWYKRNLFKKNKKIYSLFGTVLIMFAIINFMQFIPIIGSRYMWLVRSLSIYLFFKVFYKTKYEKYLWIILFTCLQFIFMRWFYKGAGVFLVSPTIYYMPAPYLIYDFIGAKAFPV